jgi:putative transposase
VAGAPRATVRYRHRRATQEPLRARLRELAAERPRFGYRRLTILVRREQGAVNHKRVYRLYRLEGLAVRRRGRKRVARTARVAPTAPQPGQHWAMDFMQDSLASGRPFRTLNIVDLATRECLAIEVDTSLPGARVVRALGAALRGPRPPHHHHHGQRPGVRRPGAGRLGLQGGGAAGLHRSREADAERAPGEF